MSNKSIVENLEEFNDVSSWLLWDVKFKHDEAAKKYVFQPGDINTKYVFVALNASYKSKELVDSWGSFHSGSSGDKNLEEAFNGSPYQGCYITDILKYEDVDRRIIFNNGKSGNAKNFIYNNYAIYNANTKILKKELDTFGNDIKIIALGWDVYNMLKYNPSLNNREIYRIPHFSPRNRNNGSDYKTSVERAFIDIKQYGLPGLNARMRREGD